MQGLHVDCVVLVSDCRDVLLAAAAWHGLLSTSGTKFKTSSLQPKCLRRERLQLYRKGPNENERGNGVFCHEWATLSYNHTLPHWLCSPLQTSTVPTLQCNSTYILFCSTHIYGHFFATYSFIFSLCFFFPSPCVVNVVIFFFTARRQALSVTRLQAERKPSYDRRNSTSKHRRRLF